MIDICLNIFNSQFDADCAEALSRAKQNGVNGCMLNIPKILALACSDPDFLAVTAGIHQHVSKKTLEHLQQAFVLNMLANIIKSRIVFAIGETGLDYQHEYLPKNFHQQLFVLYLRLARKNNEPLFLHERHAYSDFVDLIKSVSLLKRQSVVHCFIVSEVEIQRYLDFWFYLGITGWLIDRQRNKSLIGVMKFIPIDRILLEPDAIILSLPCGNEFQCFRFIVESVVALYGVSIEDVRIQTQCNTESLFQGEWHYGNV